MTDDLVERIRIAEKQEDDAKRHKKGLQQQWADENCPLSIGDVVGCCGYSHKGKQMVVERIYWREHSLYGKREYDWNPGWKVFGRVLKKDGTTSQNDAEFDDEQYAKYLEEKA